MMKLHNTEVQCCCAVRTTACEVNWELLVGCRSEWEWKWLCVFLYWQHVCGVTLFSPGDGRKGLQQTTSCRRSSHGRWINEWWSHAATMQHKATLGPCGSRPCFAPCAEKPDAVNKNQPEDTIKIKTEPLGVGGGRGEQRRHERPDGTGRPKQPADGFISLQPSVTGFISWSVRHQFLIGVICTGLCADWVGIYQRHCADLEDLICRKQSHIEAIKFFQNT